MEPTKTCPSCAQTLGSAAAVCAYCGYDFATGRRPVNAQVAAPAVPETNGFAVASLVLSILWIGGLGSLLAVIFGHKAKGQIDRSGGRQSGRGLAVAGLIIGYVGLALLLVAILAALAIPVFLSERQEGYTARLESALKTAAVAEETHAVVNNGRYTTSTADLEEVGFEAPDGVDVSVATVGDGFYCLEATDGSRTFYLHSDEVEPREGEC